MEASDYRKAILLLLAERDVGKTICPSEVLPRSQRKNKELMRNVRASAQLLVDEGQIEVTQKGKAVLLESSVGPIRLKKVEK